MPVVNVLGRGISCVLLWFGLAAAAAEPLQIDKEVWRFESVEATQSEAGKRPPPDAVWKPVALPEAWTETYPGYAGTVWYRMSINLAKVPTQPYAIYVPNRRAGGMV